MTRYDMLQFSVKELSADMYDDKRVLTITSYNISYLPLPVLVPSIPCPTSDRCDTTGVPVTPPRGSFPVIRKSHRTTVPVTFVVSIELNVPDMWSRVEDNSLHQKIVLNVPDMRIRVEDNSLNQNIVDTNYCPPTIPMKRIQSIFYLTYCPQRSY